MHAHASRKNQAQQEDARKVMVLYGVLGVQGAQVSSINTRTPATRCMHTSVLAHGERMSGHFPGGGMGDQPGDGEGPACLALPDVLLIVIVLCDDCDTVCYKVGGVETHSKLPNHGDVCSGAQGLHEGLHACVLIFTGIHDRVIAVASASGVVSPANE